MFSSFRNYGISLSSRTANIIIQAHGLHCPTQLKNCVWHCSWMLLQTHTHTRGPAGDMTPPSTCITAQQFTVAGVAIVRVQYSFCRTGTWKIFAVQSNSIRTWYCRDQLVERFRRHPSPQTYGILWWTSTRLPELYNKNIISFDRTSLFQEKTIESANTTCNQYESSKQYSAVKPKTTWNAHDV